MLDFTNNRLTPPLYEQIKCSCLYNKINKFKLYVKKKNSITYFAMKWLRYFWRRGGGGDKETQQLTNGIIITFFYYDQCPRCKFPFRKRPLPFYRHSDNFDLLLCDSVKNKEDSKWNCKPVLTWFNAMQAHSSRKKNQKPKTEFVNA